MQTRQSQKYGGRAKTGKDQRIGGESLDPVPLPSPTPPPPPPKSEGPSFTSQVIRETNIAPLSEPTTTASGVVSLFYSKNFWIALLVILLILSFLGVNFVMLMGQLFQPIVNVFWILVSQIMSLFGYTTGTVLNKTVDVVSGTAKAGIDIAEGTVQSVGNLLIKGSSSEVGPMTQAQITANIQGTGATPAPPLAGYVSPPPVTASTVEHVLPSTLDQVLNMSNRKSTKDPAPDDSTSSIQTPTWCLVGEIDGNRTCAEVKSSNLCLSGQVYKTQNKCETVQSSEGFAPLMAPPPPPRSSSDLPGNFLVQPPPSLTSMGPFLGDGPPTYIDISKTTRSVDK